MNRKFVITLFLITSLHLMLNTTFATVKPIKPKVSTENVEINNKKKAVVRYIDVNKLNIELKEKKNTVYVFKEDNKRFTKEDQENMVIKQEEILLPENNEIEIKKIPGKEVIGYNIFQNREKEYKTYQIGITNLNVNNNIKTEVNYDKVYIDIFYVSTKKVYVRHINASSFYDMQSENVIGFDEKEISLAKKITKEKTVADIYDNVSQNKENQIPSIKNEILYQEEYIIPVDKNIEIFNILDKEKKYIGYKKFISLDNRALESAKKMIYNGTPLKLGSIDNRVFTEEGYENTYIDMFYVDNKKEDIQTKIIGEAVATKLVPEGRVDAKAVNNSLNKEDLSELKIPSSEDIKLGVTNLKPYIVPDISYSLDTKTDQETNGKNYFDVTYRYGRLNNINIFTVKNNVTIQDKVKLLDRQEEINIPLKDEYINKTQNIKHIPYLINKNYIEEVKHTECGGICKDTYLEVTVKSDSIKFGDETILNDLEVKTQKYKIKEERCKIVNGEYVKDERATRYYTPDIKVIEKEDFENVLLKEIDKIKNPKRIQDIDELYKDNIFNIPTQKENGQYLLNGKLEYENKFKIGKIDSDVEKVNLIIKDKQVKPINVYTPVVANAKLTRIGNIVNHSNIDAKEGTISKNTPFILQPYTTDIEHQIYSQVKDFSKYIKEYLVSFDFDLAYYKVFNKDGALIEENNNIIEAFKNIHVPTGGRIEAQAVYEDGFVKNSPLKANGSKFYIKAVAINAPNSVEYNKALEENKERLSDDLFNKMSNSHKKYHGKDTIEEKNYSAKREIEVSTINRIYDLRIVNTRDYDFDVLYKKNNTQELSGNFSYVGIRRLNLNSKENNNLNVVNSNTLPLGPYKHPNRLFGYAPKVGYYIDFDLKTTGAFTNNTNKYIEIKPEFYYLSKDGRTLKMQDEIDIYYSQGKGKQIKVGSSQDTFKITMVPSDSEQYIKDYDKEFVEKKLSKDQISIGNISKITLNANTNTISKIKDQEQLWVGRYRLPSTTFVVNKNEKELKNKLQDGYLGVKFNIKCIQKNGPEEIILDYSQNDKQDNRPNTSQFDMEGNLGANYGVENNLSIKLEKGDLNIPNDLYNKLKGTVLLYDLDRYAEGE